MLELDVDEQRGPTKAGRPIPLVDLRVVDEEMRDVPARRRNSGRGGRPRTVADPKLLKNPDASETLWEGGYLHTGDIGDIDQQGYLQITDRIKDVIKSGGEWISSLDIENILCSTRA